MPVNLLAVWEPGQAEPWYLATTLERDDWTERLYRWRMRLESSNRDEKTGVLLRQGGDRHALRNILHLHRLLLALLAARWLCALVGLQAHRDLADPPRETALDEALPTTPPDSPPARARPGRAAARPPASWPTRPPARLDAALRRPRPPQLPPARGRGAAGPGPRPDRPPLRPLARHLPLDLDAALVPLAAPLSPQTLVARRVTQSGAPQDYTPPVPRDQRSQQEAQARRCLRKSRPRASASLPGVRRRPRTVSARSRARTCRRRRRRGGARRARTTRA